jgi:MFS family permease
LVITAFRAVQKSAISTSALVGAVLGQVFFGSLADRLGRKRIFLATITLVVVGALGSASVVQGDAVDIYAQLCIWLCECCHRVLLPEWRAVNQLMSLQSS